MPCLPFILGISRQSKTKGTTGAGHATQSFSRLMLIASTLESTSLYDPEWSSCLSQTFLGKAKQTRVGTRGLSKLRETNNNWVHSRNMNGGGYMQFQEILPDRKCMRDFLGTWYLHVSMYLFLACSSLISILYTVLSPI